MQVGSRRREELIAAKCDAYLNAWGCAGGRGGEDCRYEAAAREAGAGADNFRVAGKRLCGIGGEALREVTGLRM